MMEISWGIIGCGDVTEVKSGPAFNKINSSRLQAVMRRNAEKVKDYATRHKVPKYYTNASELINDPEVNAVYVATPPAFHEAYAIEALQAGKPVYLEKPVALNAASAKRIADAAKQHGVKLSIAHYRREQPLFKKIKDLLNSRFIGDIRFIDLRLFQAVKKEMLQALTENWVLDPAISGGGLFHDLAPHSLDLMLYFFGAPSYTQGLSFNQGAFYKADDIVNGAMVFDRKIIFNGLWSFAVPAHEARDSCEIIGSEGKIRFGIFQNQGITIARNGIEETLNFDPLPHVQQPMIEKVVQYFLGQSQNPCSGEEGVEVMKMMDIMTMPLKKF